MIKLFNRREMISLILIITVGALGFGRAQVKAAQWLSSRLQK